MAKTVVFGLSNVHYAVVTETTQSGVTTSSYGTVKPWPGAVSMSMQASQDKSVFRADNSDYYVSYGEGQYSGTLETAMIPESLKKDLGWLKEDDNNVLVESSDDYKVTKYVALLWEFNNDEKATRHVFYKTSFSRADVSGQTTGEGGTIEPQTETVNITAVPRADADRYIHAETTSTTGTTTYNSWYTNVYVPTFTPGD